MRKPASSAEATLRYLLSPSPEARVAIDEMFDRYREMGTIVTELSEGSGSNLRLLHDKAYGTIRDRTGLPARLISLGFRDFIAHEWNPDSFGIPLDEGLFTIKGPDILTISTVQGRVEVAYDVAGYLTGWSDPFWARLVRADGAYEVRVGVTPKSPIERDQTMARDSILTRVGRLLAGAANSAIDHAEGQNPVMVVEQAIREIELYGNAARADLGKAKAEEYRLTTRRDQLSREIGEYEGKIQLALDQNRQDLARSGAAHQIDLENQVAALDRALSETREDIDDATQALSAVNGAKREAEDRLAELKKSISKTPGVGPSKSSPAKADPRAGAERASQAISRVTGVPGGAPSASADLDELDRLARDKAIEERLARFSKS